MIIAVGADNQQSQIMVHSPACSSSDVVWNACAAYSAFVHTINRAAAVSRCFSEHETMQILPCADACTQAYSIIAAL